jgi:hypothetical protein
MYFCLKQKNEFGKYFFRETLFTVEMRWCKIPLTIPFDKKKCFVKTINSFVVKIEMKVKMELWDFINERERK